MILYPDRMYYNIHTHRISNDPEVVTILNTIVGRSGEKPDGNDPEGSFSSSPLIRRSYGIHPWYISDVDAQMAELRNKAGLPEVVAIGEAGLDKVTGTALPLQEKVFIEQILLAEQLEKPLIIHCVKAWPELMQIKKRMNTRMPWIIHGFRGKGELATQLIRQGCFLSFGYYFNPEAVRAAWPERILAETDEGDPDIRAVYRRLTGALDISFSECSLQLAGNVRTLFPLLPG